MNRTEQKLKTGLQFHEAGQFEDARQCYQSILQNEPEHADARHLLGMLAYREGDYEAAVDEINRALVRLPANVLYLNNLGSVYRAQGCYNERSRRSRGRSRSTRAMPIRTITWGRSCSHSGNLPRPANVTKRPCRSSPSILMR